MTETIILCLTFIFASYLAIDHISKLKWELEEANKKVKICEEKEKQKEIIYKVIVENK